MQHQLHFGNGLGHYTSRVVLFFAWYWALVRFLFRQQPGCAFLDFAHPRIHFDDPMQQIVVRLTLMTTMRHEDKAWMV